MVESAPGGASEAGGSGGPPPLDIDLPEAGGGPEAKKITIPERRERARERIAMLLVIIFAIEVLGAMLALWLCGETRLQQLKDILPLILGPTVAVVGSVLGFYFGGKENGDGGSSAGGSPG